MFKKPIRYCIILIIKTIANACYKIQCTLSKCSKNIPPPPRKTSRLLEFSDLSENITKSIGYAWVENMYYSNAEQEQWLETFWNKDTYFYKCFKQLDCSNIVELACGHGRHVQKYLDKASNVTLVDINQQNIDFCKKRFLNETKIKYIVNTGNDFNGIETNSQTAVFTYDAMVHFEMMDILSYIKDANRILIEGGKILFHHSNAAYLPELGWNKPYGRNFMSADIFAYLALRHGFIVLSQNVFDWNNTMDSDCLSLCKKIRTIG